MALKFGIGTWCFGNTADRFMPVGYKKPITLEEIIEGISKVEKIKGVELVYPDDFSNKDPDAVLELLKKYNLTPIVVGPNLSGRPHWGKGSLASLDEEIRKRAVKLTKETIDVATKLGKDVLVNIWLGQDGYDYPFQVPYDLARRKLIESIREIADYNPKVRISLEYKIKEPRTHLFISTAAVSLLLVRDIGRDNVGVTIDVGHSLMAYENMAEAATLLLENKKLYHLHFNDNYRMWDDDMIVGTIHTIEFIELLYWLRKLGYEGWYSLDIFPYRESAEDAARESIEYLELFDKLAQRLDKKKIYDLLTKGDAPEIHKLIRESIFK